MKSKTIFTALLALSLVVATGGVGAAVMGASDIAPNLTESEVEHEEDDEYEREERFTRDNDSSITVTMNEAHETADGVLSEPDNANWTLVEASVHEEDGYLEFEYVLEADNRTGEAEVRVDGSSGDVFRIEEEIEPMDDDADEEDEVEVEDEADEMEDDGDEFEGTEDEFEGTASAVSESANTVTLDDGRVVDVSDAMIEDDTDLESLEEVANHLANGHTVEVEGDAQLADGSADLTAESVKYEVEDEMEDEAENEMETEDEDEEEDGDEDEEEDDD
jgi:hypothetical protein